MSDTKQEQQEEITEWTEVKGAEAHNFQEEPTLEGELLRDEESQFGGKNYIIKRASDDKEVVVFGKTVIQTKLNRIAQGKTIRITSLGQVKSEKTGRSYQDFKIETKD